MKLKKIIAFVTAFAITAALLPHSDAVGTVKAEELGEENIIAEESGAEDSPPAEEIAEGADLPEEEEKTGDAANAAVNTETGEINAVTSSDSKYEYTTNNNGEATITKYLGTETRVVIPDRIDGYKVTVIGGGAFKDSIKLESVELNGNLTTIGTDYSGGAFENCTSLTTVKFNDALTTIKGSTFKGCEMLKEAKFGANLSSVGYRAFEGCKELVVLEFTNTADTRDTELVIEQYAFNNCERLKKVVFPNSLSAINGGAFTNCTRLEEVELNGNLKTIGTDYIGGAFENCTSLTTVKFNDALTTIKGSTF